MLKKYFPGIVILVPLLIGIAIYVLRPVPPIAIVWIDELGFAQWLASFRQAMKIDWLPAWAVYSLPNGLWIYSYTAVITYIWLPTNRSLGRSIWLSSVLILGIGYEALQLTSFLPGVFCLYDLLFVSCGVVLGFIVAKLLLVGRIHSD